jgi:hypothetical protein
LHDLGRDPARKFVLIEAQALREHVAVEIPAQAHREIAGERLPPDQALHADQQRAARENCREQQQITALGCPQLGRLDFGEPIDDVPEHAEQQRLERADDRGRDRHRDDVGAHAARAGPDEREEAARQLRRRSIGIRRY